ncbi:MAG: ribonuclease E inhibitor RraB [Planctomycetota bacterium]
MTFPNDTNGDVLRRMAASGDDLTKPRDVDFVHVMPDRRSAVKMAGRAKPLGYATRVMRSDDGAWETLCTIHMVPDHAAITAREKELADLARSFDGYADGWGCFET